MDWHDMRVAALACFGLSMALVSCGGGGGNGSAPEGEGIAVTSVAKGAVKVLTDTQALAVTFPTSSTVEIDSSADVQAGDVVAVGNMVLKLVESAPASSSGMKRFTTTTPHLDDIFASLTLNGTLTSSNQLGIAGSAHRVQALSAPTKSCASDPAVLGLAGTRCNFTLTSTQYPIVSLSGSAAVGHKLELKQWDVINNTGAGKITLTFDGDIAYKLNKDSASLLVESDACTSTREAVAGARARLFTIQVPTNIPAVNVRIPVCLAFDAKAGISGTIFKFSHQAIIEIAVGNGTSPKLTSIPPSTSGTGRAADAEIWTVDSSTATLATALLETSASGSLAAEISVEVAAGLPSRPEATIVDLGLSAAVTGKAEVSGKVAPAVVNIGKTLASIAADPLYCLSIGMGVDLDLTGYAGLPAFRLLGLNANVSKKLYTKEIWKSPAAQLGKCDFKVKTDTTVTSSPNPGRDVTFTVSVVKNDPASGRLWDDRKASGTAEVRNGAGAVMCTATIVNGTGSCGFVYTGADRTEVVLTKYLGDEYFLASSSNSYEHIVVSAPPPTMTAELLLQLPAPPTQVLVTTLDSSGAPGRGSVSVKDSAGNSIGADVILGSDGRTTFPFDYTTYRTYTFNWIKEGRLQASSKIRAIPLSILSSTAPEWFSNTGTYIYGIGNIPAAWIINGQGGQVDSSGLHPAYYYVNYLNYPTSPPGGYDNLATIEQYIFDPSGTRPIGYGKLVNASYPGPGVSVESYSCSKTRDSAGATIQIMDFTASGYGPVGSQLISDALLHITSCGSWTSIPLPNGASTCRRDAGQPARLFAAGNGIISASTWFGDVRIGLLALNTGFNTYFPGNVSCSEIVQ